MHVTLTPSLAADIKRTAEDALMNRLETISSGERLSLAHRASGRIAAELLCDTEPRVIHGALDNSQLTEAEVIRADRKSTRLNSSHGYISYAVFCLKKKKTHMPQQSVQ